MKTKKTYLIIVLLAISTNIFSQFRIDNNGFIYFEDFTGGYGGVTTSIVVDKSGTYSYATIRPVLNKKANLGSISYQWYTIRGQYIYLNGSIVLTSDKKTKENIDSITNAKEKILLLQGVKYDRICEDKEAPDSEKYKNNLGLIAQDVLPILPEVVNYDEESELYGINYIGIIPVLIEAFKEQNEIITELQSKVEKLEKDKLKSTSLSIEDDFFEENSYLMQNQPNPFSESTTIYYSLSKNTVSAGLYIYDLQGKQIQNFNITEFGNSQLTINGYELTPGMYYYTLIADGKEIDTKKMILTD